ncbi:MAG: polysulfide reductase NrfD [Nitrospiraceae bacterium]|nr:polysulfide reductase NrfD [Nitrospiraceae bacterium]
MTTALINFFKDVTNIFKGGPKYYGLMGILIAVVAVGFGAYYMQADRGLIVTAMRDQVAWGFYIANFTFLVGVAAAAVLLVIPAYLYKFKPIKEVVLFGEIMAVTAISMCLLFIMVDVGRPLFVWHMLPVIGTINFPASLLGWDFFVLNGYLAVNLAALGYVLYRYSQGKPYDLKVLLPIVIISIPMAFSIHTVTAFLYGAVKARPFWNVSILAPRFLASAFCSGPALMLLVFQALRKYEKVDIEDKAMFKIAEIITYALGINLFFLFVEIFTDFYANTLHGESMHYLFFGIDGKTNLVPFIWTAVVLNLIAFAIMLTPKYRYNYKTLNIALVMMIIGVYIEKGMGLVIPGQTPDTLGDLYEYMPTVPELLISIGVWGIGALIYITLVKFALPKIRAAKNFEH